MYTLVQIFLKKLSKKSHGKNILIYSPGRCGSTSLELRLDGATHVHHLYRNSIFNTKKIPRQMQYSMKDKLRQLLIRIRVYFGYYDIILIPARDELERAISMFFHLLPGYLYIYNQYGNTKYDLRYEMDFNYLVEAFAFSQEYENSSNWYKDELFRLLPEINRMNTKENFTTECNHIKIVHGVVRYIEEQIAYLKVDLHDNIIPKYKYQNQIFNELKEEFSRTYGNGSD